MSAQSTTIDLDELNALIGNNVATIDGTQIGNTTLVTNAFPDKDFYITDAGVKLVSASGVSARPSVNVGKTSPNFNDIISGASLNALTTVGSFVRPSLTGQLVVIAPGESLVFRVTTGATATDYTIKVIVRGFYA